MRQTFEFQLIYSNDVPRRPQTSQTFKTDDSITLKNLCYTAVSQKKYADLRVRPNQAP
jgi:hypothetical protein